MGMKFTVNNSIKGPEIECVDTKSGTVYFKPHDGFYLDVYSKTRKAKGPHVHNNGKKYPDHKGKRFMMFHEVGYDNSWTVPFYNGIHRKYYKFVLRDQNMNMSTLSTATVVSSIGGEKCKLKIISM